MPTRAQELAVLRSVIYASLFDYPLTLSQLRESLVEVAADEPTILAWWRASPLLQSAIEHRSGLFFPAGRAELVATRARREALSRDLLRRDRRLFTFVAGLPFVRMVALSGSLAHLNAERSADVDLFVITAANRVWLVTVTALVIAKVAGWRRRLCLNYVISERQLSLAPGDLFSANQIIHLQPVAGHETYRRFLDCNGFVAHWYPNFRRRDAGAATSVPGSSALERVLSATIAPAAERACRALYRRHLRRQASSWRSADQVRLDDECLKLHTSSHRGETMARFDAVLAAAVAGEPATASTSLDVA